MDIDRSEMRYLLTSGGDGLLCLYDLQSTPLRSESAKTCQPIEPVTTFTRAMATYSNPNQLARGIRTVQWYPVDTGMFFTGSIDGFVSIWDTNLEKETYTFNMEQSVNAISMSVTPSSTQLLIAVATNDQKARLCDIRSHSSTHCLSGHRERVLAIQWAPYSPFVLATGSEDKTIRLWDIRRSDTCLLALDQHNESRVNNNDNNNSNNTSGGGGGGYSSVPDYSVLKSNNRKYFKRPATWNSSIRPGETSQISPNMSAKDAPFAHNGAVTDIIWSGDGQVLYSSGNDSKIRKWDMNHGTNTFVDFPSALNQFKQPTQMALSHDSNYLFHPNGKTINMYDTKTGDLVKYLKGHFEKVTCCVFHPTEEIFISGSNDKQLLIWDTSAQGKEDDQSLTLQQQFHQQQQLKDDLVEINQQLITTQEQAVVNQFSENQRNVTLIDGTNTNSLTMPDIDDWSDDEQ